MTAGPSAGPASAYPTLSRPASICFSGPNDVFVPGLAGPALGALFVFPERALVSADAGLNMANSAAAIVMAELRKKRRRPLLTCSDISFPPIWINCSLLSYFLSPASDHDWFG